MKSRVSLALVHWPILNKAGDVVATNVTNFDIHDIARCCQVYGIHRYFIVNRLKEQLMFVERVLEHWHIGEGSKLNPMRQRSLRRLQAEEYLEGAISQLGPRVRVIATAARDIKNKPALSFQDLRQQLQVDSEDVEDILLVFGTGFGLSPEALGLCGELLEPIRGVTEEDYRHLSVRSAVSICLDRILGQW